MALLFMVSLPAVLLPAVAPAQPETDPVTGFAREPIHVTAWAGGKKVAVSFALFVEEFGFGQGPVYRPDMASRNPDLVNEAFRQYAINWGISRVGAGRRRAASRRAALRLRTGHSRACEQTVQDA
jgi:hypothetical protein